MTDFVQFPDAAASWAPWLDETVDAAIETNRRTLAELKDGSPRDSAEVMRRYNESDIALANANALVHSLAEVHPDEAVRTLAEQRAQELNRIDTDRSLDRDLYDVVAATADEGDDEQRRFRDRVLREFRRSGVDKDESVRERVRAISDRLTVLGQDFSRATRDDVRSIRIRPEQLDGLPQDYIDAHQPDDDGLVTITTDYPDCIPLRTFARDSAARYDSLVAYLNRAYPQNDPVLHEMFDLRAELAGLLGYDGWPDYDAEVKMTGSGRAIGEFIDAMATASADAAQRDYDQLLDRARADDPDAAAVSRADFAYYEELVRREQFDVDAQEVRKYFDFGRVRQGLLDTTARLFGVAYEQRTDLPVWHEDVTVYDVRRDGAVIGRIYLDLHPREGKYKHAAQFDLVSGVEGRQLPEGALVCNFARGLLEHREVVTMFHEFGHLVHHILGGGQRYARFSGVATEWDFVEAPSQMLEEWAWDADVLRTFAADADGTPIPDDLVARMRAAEEFGKGLFVRVQTCYSAISYRLHRDRPSDLTAALREIQTELDPFGYVDGTHFHASFGHLSGYTSGYYTYLWSKVIAKDLFSAFDPGDLFDAEIAGRYRDAILARGGSRDAAELVADFLRRPYSFDAFRTWLDTPPEKA